MEDPADRPHLEVRHKGLLTLAVMAGVIMQVLDSTIANVALPHMRATLGATPDTISWVLTSYIVTAAIVIPAAGWMADRIGIRTLFLCSVTLFVVSSMLCGLAQNLPQMVAARVFQGIGGAALGPLGQTVMLNINRPSDHPKALSLFSIGMMVGPIVGPVVGGWLTDNLDWRWVFLINVPIGALSLTGLWLLMPRVKPIHRPFDLTGWALIAVALAALQLLLDRGEQIDWFDSTEAWIEAGVLASAAWMFGVHSALVKRPLFSPRLLRDANLIAGCLFMIVLSMVQIGAMALMPTMMQSLLGYPVLTTGAVLATRGFGLALAMHVAGRLLPLTGPRPLIALGMSLAIYTLWEMTRWSLDIDSRRIIINGIIQGFGTGCVYLPVMVAAFSSLPPHLRTDGAALINLARNTGSSFGIAVGIALLTRNTQISHADLAAHVTPYNLAVDPTLLGLAGQAGEAAREMVDGLVQRQATMIAYLDDFYFNLMITICALPAILLIRYQRPANRAALAAAAAME